MTLSSPPSPAGALDGIARPGADPGEASKPGSGKSGGHRRFIPSARTNLPVWPDRPPEVDPSGRAYILAGSGGATAPVLEGWRRDIEAAGRSCRMRIGLEAEPSADLLAWLRQVLAEARIGCRLMLAGPASEVLRLAAAAREAGLLDAEIRAFAVEDGTVQCHCIHCRTDFRCEGEPGSVVSCPGCGRALLIHQHLSRRSASFVAFVADIEHPR